MNERRKKLEQLCRQHNIVILYSFGSRAREALAWLEGEVATLQPSVSDLGIGIKISRGVALSLDEQIQLTQVLEDLFGIHRVDLVDLDRAKAGLAAEVIHGERLYA